MVISPVISSGSGMNASFLSPHPAMQIKAGNLKGTWRDKIPGRMDDDANGPTNDQHYSCEWDTEKRGKRLNVC